VGLASKGNEAQSCQSSDEKFDANMRGKEAENRNMKNPERTTVEESRFWYKSSFFYTNLKKYNIK